MKITKIEDRVTKTAQPYLYVEVDGGTTKENKLSCFKESEFVWGMLRGALISGEPVDLTISEVKGFRNIVGIAGVQAPPKEGKVSKGAIGAAMDRKEASIKGFTERKEASMKTQGIWRDSALFASAEIGSWKDVSAQNLKDAYERWLKYFEAQRQ